MTTDGQPTDPANADLFWMFHDAFGLFHLGKKPTALLLLLCAVNALAERAYSQVEAQAGEKFRRFLGERLPKYTKAASFDVRIRGQGELLRVEAVLYEFLRNPTVDGGFRFDMEKVSNVAVNIDWADDARYLRWGDREGRLVIGGDWLVDVVGGVVKEATSVQGAADPQEAPQAQGAE